MLYGSEYLQLGELNLQFLCDLDNFNSPWNGRRKFAIHNDVIVFLVRDSNERAICYSKSVCQSVTRVDQSGMVEVRITHTIYLSSFCRVCFIHKFWRVALSRGIKRGGENWLFCSFMCQYLENFTSCKLHISCRLQPGRRPWMNLS